MRKNLKVKHIIADVSTFVEILNDKGELVLRELQKTPIKGRLRKVSKADM